MLFQPLLKSLQFVLTTKTFIQDFFYLLPYKKAPPQLGYQQRKKKYFNLISQGIDYPNFIVTRRIVIFLRPV